MTTLFDHEMNSIKCLYLFIKNKVWDSFVFCVEEDCSLQAKLWDEYNDRVLPHKQNKSLFVKYASALEEQLQRNQFVLKAWICSKLFCILLGVL